MGPRRLLLVRRRVEGLPARPRHAPVAGSCSRVSDALEQLQPGRLRARPLSLHDWIDKYVPAGHQSNFGRLLDSAYNEEYGSDTTDQSSLNLVFLLGFKAKPGNFQIFGASNERFHIAGGNQQLPDTMASYLTGTGLTTIATGTRMNTIALNGNGSVSLWFDGSKSPAVYDQVILTTSFSVLRTLDYSKAGFDALKKTAITQLGSGRNGKLQLQFDTRYWNQTGPWGLSNGDVYTDYGLQNVWDVTPGPSRTQRASSSTTRAAASPAGSSPRRRTRTPRPASRSRPTRKRSCSSSRRSSRASRRTGTAGPACRPRSSTRTCSARTPTGASGSTPSSAATRARRRAPPARSTSRASTAPPTSRDSWREAPPRASGRPRRSSAPSSRDP